MTKIAKEMAERAKLSHKARELLAHAGYAEDATDEDFLAAYERASVEPLRAASTKRLERMGSAVRSTDLPDEAVREALTLYADELLAVRGIANPSLEEYLDAIHCGEIALGMR